MPTPFYHISVAEDLLTHPDLNDDIRVRLQQGASAFIFGNTAPDVQVISGQPREATHFFRIPIPTGAKSPWARMLESYPSLSEGGASSTDRDVFIAGWLCHLQADWFWVKKIFIPVFGYHAAWRDFETRLYLHNVLRSYLDLQIHQRMNGKISGYLSSVHPEEWLPFVRDEHLITWKDYLVRQLQPGSKIETVEVFAARQGMPTDAYYELIGSEREMDQQVFNHIPRPVLDVYRQDLIGQNLTLIHQFFGRD